jgi:hypothetical protein
VEMSGVKDFGKRSTAELILRRDLHSGIRVGVNGTRFESHYLAV